MDEYYYNTIRLFIIQCFLYIKIHFRIYGSLLYEMNVVCVCMNTLLRLTLTLQPSENYRCRLLTMFWLVGLLVGWFMVFNATCNNISVISWQLVLSVGETGVRGENHQPVTTPSH
jgi:hypothetical protein